MASTVLRTIARTTTTIRRTTDVLLELLRPIKGERVASASFALVEADRHLERIDGDSPESAANLAAQLVGAATTLLGHGDGVQAIDESTVQLAAELADATVALVGLVEQAIRLGAYRARVAPPRAVAA